MVMIIFVGIGLFTGRLLVIGFTNYGYVTLLKVSAPKFIQSQTFEREAIGLANHWWEKAIILPGANYHATFRGLGYAMALEGQASKAVSYWQLGKMDVWFLVARGDRYFQNGRYKDALFWFERAVDLQPTWSDFRYDMGRVYETLGENAKALFYYDQAIALNRFCRLGISSTYYRKGVIYQSRYKDYSQALSAYTTAVNLGDFTYPNEEADVHYLIGFINFEYQNDINTAILEYKKAIELNPHHYWASLRLGQAYYWGKGLLVEAETKILSAIDIWPQDDSLKWPYMFLGDIFQGAGQPEKAKQVYLLALAIDPDNPELLQRLEMLKE